MKRQEEEPRRAWRFSVRKTAAAQACRAGRNVAQARRRASDCCGPLRRLSRQAAGRFAASAVRRPLPSPPALKATSPPALPPWQSADPPQRREPRTGALVSIPDQGAQGGARPSLPFFQGHREAPGTIPREVGRPFTGHPARPACDPSRLLSSLPSSPLNATPRVVVKRLNVSKSTPSFWSKGTLSFWSKGGPAGRGQTAHLG
jgi:hypothetical protein